MGVARAALPPSCSIDIDRRVAPCKAEPRRGAAERPCTAAQGGEIGLLAAHRQGQGATAWLGKRGGLENGLHRENAAVATAADPQRSLPQFDTATAAPLDSRLASQVFPGDGSIVVGEKIPEEGLRAETPRRVGTAQRMGSTAITPVIDLGRIARRLGLPAPGVQAVVELLDAGNTIPFVARYRRDQTGGLDEEAVRQVQTAITRARQLADRKQTILRTIQGQGKLTGELEEAIVTAESPKQLEDLYLPYKPRKLSLAEVARQRRLEPLAREILVAAPAAADLDHRAADFVDAEANVPTVADVLLGVGHIIAEDFSERADLRQRLRGILHRAGQLRSQRVETEGKALSKDEKHFRDYFAYSERLERVPAHRLLAINRGERARLLKVRIEGPAEDLQAAADEMLVPAGHPHGEFLRGCARDALARLVLPSLEREMRREMTDACESHAVEVFARNLRNLLLQPPAGGRRVLSLDPGFKSGCKAVVIDECGM
ncbi:MAG: hypothetical protein FJ284_02825, partial [Planctomycetes bacterium]|nr:hypothetical protein [Planctomycetota bacterium]